MYRLIALPDITGCRPMTCWPINSMTAEAVDCTAIDRRLELM